jgi:hypothetical protein
MRLYNEFTYGLFGIGSKHSKDRSANYSIMSQNTYFLLGDESRSTVSNGFLQLSDGFAYGLFAVTRVERQ